MQIHQRLWGYFQSHRVISLVLGQIFVLLVLAILFTSSAWGPGLFGAFASSHCASSDQTYIVKSGDTLGGIAARYHTTVQRLASYNHIANPNVITVNETICVQGTQSSPPPSKGSGNPFPYGQCTWWASNRYHQLHNIYVPWTTQSNAWQWAARANQFHWRVSNSPSPGAIVDLQPWVQGAYGLGHVAVVERVLSNGHVIASSMNWGVNPSSVTDVEFAPGSGVTFLSY